METRPDFTPGSGVFVVAVVSSAEQRGLYANSDPHNTAKDTVCDLEWLH